MKQRALLGLTCVAAAMLLSACSSMSECLEPQPYMQAQQLPPLSNPPGLDVPRPDADMAIPDVARGPVGQYDNPPGAATSAFAHCLVAPPPMSQAGV